MVIDPEILDAAVDWHASLEGEAPDYDGFAAWLEADARHRHAYDRVIVLDTLMVDHARDLPLALPANDDAPVRPSERWRFAGMAAAIALVVGMGALTLRDKTPDQIEVATERGTSRTIKLADASAVTLDGNSALYYTKENERAITLVNGSAHFAVKHDAARPFAITVGGYQIRDLGTEFTVSNTKGHLSINVSRGLVDVSGPGMSRLSVTPGDRIDIESGKVEKSHIDPSTVGSWRQGRLIYNNAPLRLVVADINRYADQSVLLDPSLSDRRFSGVLTIGDGSQLAPTLANVMAIPLTRDKDSVRLGIGGISG